MIMNLVPLDSFLTRGIEPSKPMQGHFHQLKPAPPVLPAAGRSRDPFLRGIAFPSCRPQHLPRRATAEFAPQPGPRRGLYQQIGQARDYGYDRHEYAKTK